MTNWAKRSNAEIENSAKEAAKKAIKMQLSDFGVQENTKLYDHLMSNSYNAIESGLFDDKTIDKSLKNLYIYLKMPLTVRSICKKIGEYLSDDKIFDSTSNTTNNPMEIKLDGVYNYQGSDLLLAVLQHTGISAAINSIEIAMGQSQMGNRVAHR